MEYDTCDDISTDGCDSCLSGDRDCLAVGDKHCNFPGFCDGQLISLQLAYSSHECHAVCLTQENCAWYNYEDVEKICITVESCDLLEQSPNSVTGRRDCKPSAGK